MKNKKINTVLLTGGTGKIGGNLIKGLAEQGYQVLFTSRSKEKIKMIEEQFSTKKVKGVQINLENDDFLKVLESFFVENNIYPQALINNARNIDYLKISDNYEVEEKNWFGEFKFSVTIPYQLTLFLSKNKNTNLQRVINVASMYGVVAPNLELYTNPDAQSPISYGTCKAAMIHLSKELAVRLAKQNILVNTISYGGVVGRVNEKFLERYAKLNPQKRMLQDEELYAPVRFLLSEDATAMTGHNLNYDGGWTAW